MALGKKPIDIVKEGKHQLLTKAEHWNRIQLKDVARVQNGFAFGSEYFSKSDGLPLIRIRDIESIKTVDKYTGSYNEDFSVKKGDILIGMDGDFKVAKWKGENGLLNQRVCRILPFNEEYNREFLFLCLQPFLNAINAETSSVTVKHLSSRTIEEIPLPCPPLEEQHLIVEKIEELFSELDKGIENLKTAQHELKVYRQAVLKWAFEGKLTNENVQDGVLPEGWQLTPLGKTIEKSKYGTSKKCDYAIKGIPVLRIPNVVNGVIDGSDLKYAEFDDNEISGLKLKEGDLLTIRSNGSVDIVGKCALIAQHDEKYLYAGYLIRLRPIHDVINPKFLLYAMSSSNLREQIENKAKSTSGVNNINTEEIKSLTIAICNLEQQQVVIQEIESRLSVCDKIEETLTASLQQAEALRQSILKKAFEGKLVKKQKIKPIQKPKNVYFYQMQVLAMIAAASKEKGINHGEMTLAKYAYLLDKVFQIPTYYDYKRWHLGPYPPEMKKAVNNHQFFTKVNSSIEVKDMETLAKYSNPYTERIKQAIDELAEIFSPLPNKSRSHQTELFATVCKVIEDIKTTDVRVIRESMAEWVIDLPNTTFRNKAEKFSEAETQECLKIITDAQWERKLLY